LSFARPNPPRYAEPALERCAVPLRRVRGRGVRACQEIEQCRFRVRGLTHLLVRENELTESLVIVSGGRHRLAGKTGRLGVGVGIEGGAREGVIPGPEAGAAHLVRIRFAGYFIRESRYATGMPGRPPSGEARDGEIEAAPEEMDRAHLAEEA